MDYSTPIEAAQNDGLKDIIEGVLAVNNVRCLNDAEDRDAVRDDLYDALRRLHGTTALRRVYGKGRFFSIAVLYRSDLAELGYDTSRVDDATMMRLAARMTDAYCANVFSIDLPIIADNLCIPKREQLSPRPRGWRVVPPLRRRRGGRSLAHFTGSRKALRLPRSRCIASQLSIGGMATDLPGRDLRSSPETALRRA